MYQKLTLVGNVGRDPEMNYMPSGDAVTSFTVACSDRWTNKDGEKQEKTTWYRVSVFGASAENVNKYLKKGNKVLVEGVLQADENGGPRVWNDSEGNPRASFEIRAFTWQNLSPKSDNVQEEKVGITEDEIPF